MSQEIANLCTDASPQPQDLNLRIRLSQTGSDWAKSTPSPSPAVQGSVSKARRQLVDSSPKQSQAYKTFWLSPAPNETRQEVDLETRTVPQLPANFVSRKRLLDKLSAANVSFIQIVAPAGYGKSSLVADWLRVAQRQNVWLSLSEKDDSLPQFWKRLVHAINILFPGAGTSTLQMLASSMSPTVQGLMTMLCRDLYKAAQAHKTAPAVLVIDNYQAIQSQTIHSRLLDLINLLPKQLQIIILSRQEIPYETSRIHAPQVVIQPMDLAFTTSEASLFFQKSTNRPSTLANALEIAEYVEGWVAGLHLIAAKIEQQPSELSEIIFLKNRKPIVSALMSETFNAAHPTLQVFMLCTSLLSKFTPDLCDSLFTGELQSMMFGKATNTNSGDMPEFKNSREMIEHLAKTGQFISTCKGSTDWYCYHPMFAEMLRAELRQRCAELELIFRDRSQLWYLRHDSATKRYSK